MKIRINEHETYDMNFPAEISMQEVAVISDRLNRIIKLFGKDIVLENVKHLKSEKIIKSVKSNRKRFPEKVIFLRANREAVKELFLAYYTKTDEEFMAVVKKHDLQDYIRDRQVFAKNSVLVKLKSLHKLTPNEVGLKKWLGHGERKKDCLL
jgi:hypothetical protein